MNRRILLYVVTALAYSVVMGFSFSLGSLYTDLIDRFEQSRTVTGSIQALLVAIINSLGFVPGALIRRFGLFKIALPMAMLLPTGIATAFFATRIEHLYISVAIVTGFGMCLFNVLSITLIGTMFEGRQRNICYSLLYVGTGTTGVIYPYFLQLLVSCFGLMGTFLILGGIFSNVWVLPILIQSTNELNSLEGGIDSSVSQVDRNTITRETRIKWGNSREIASDLTTDATTGCTQCKLVINKQRKNHFSSCTPNQEYKSCVISTINTRFSTKEEPSTYADVDSFEHNEPSSSFYHYNGDTTHREIETITTTHTLKEQNASKRPETENGIEEKHEAIFGQQRSKNAVRLAGSFASHKASRKCDTCIISRRCIDSHLVTDLKRVLFAENVLNVTGYGLLMAILNFYLSSQLDIANWKGFSKDDGLNSFVILNCVTIFAGFVPGLMKLIPRCSISFLFVALSIISVSAHVLVIFTSSRMLYFIANGLVGLALGGVLTTANIALKISPKDLVSISAGFLVTMNGLLTVTLGPILGYIRDSTGSYKPVLYTAVGLHVIVTSLFVFAFCCRKKTADESGHTIEINGVHSASRTMDQSEYGTQSKTHL